MHTRRQRLSRIIWAGGRAVVLDGNAVRTPEVLVFELDGGRRITRVEVFIQTPGR